MNSRIIQFTGILEVATQGQGFVDITGRVAAWVRERQAQEGLLTLFIRHTSASLVIQENADPDVRVDLVAAFDRLAPRNAGYLHRVEGPDDMPAHIKATLAGANVAVPVNDGRPMLGTWQGIYVFEHRDRPHRREVALHYIGTARAEA
ncbi:secondary thiamine-phosphate synthase enzyme YjbQ [Rhodoligotrophos defluvii]|uniref:secondary thiamine-phosphate synthase enzyme YjbQ n=1 Tax=Rhodoligotrophos defluvii TaxID=2561934 RepID=UPI0010C94991|nr:secondary thiamine-phosphate synthase enzyme YjbQ [Rhodoligotrophos defluvii]